MTKEGVLLLLQHIQAGDLPVEATLDETDVCQVRGKLSGYKVKVKLLAGQRKVKIKNAAEWLGMKDAWHAIAKGD
jgi:hypothetical protein